MGSISDISTYLVAKLQTITGINPSYVFDYENPELKGFPWITVVLNDSEAEFITNSQNLRTSNFTIRIYQELSEHLLGPDNAETRLRTIADSVIAAIDADYKLGGRCIFTEPSTARLGWIQDRPIRTIEIDLKCKEIITLGNSNALGSNESIITQGYGLNIRDGSNLITGGY